MHDKHDKHDKPIWLALTSTLRGRTRDLLEATSRRNGADASLMNEPRDP